MRLTGGDEDDRLQIEGKHSESGRREQAAM